MKPRVLTTASPLVAEALTNQAPIDESMERSCGEGAAPDVAELKQAIAEIIRRHLPAPVAGELPDHQDLAALGLDSLRFVTVLAELDRELEVEVPDEMLDFENFRTLGAACATVLSLRRSGGTASP